MKYLFIALQIPLFIRFLLEFSSANAFMEPISTIRQITNPVVLPMKKLIPLPWVQKFAAEKVAFIIAIIGGLLVYKNLIVGALVLHVEAWLFFLQYGIFIYVIGSWVRVPAMARVNYLFQHVFEPLLAPIRKVVPSIGGMIDISPMILWFAIVFVANTFFAAIG